jgi:hypothetical protein
MKHLSYLRRLIWLPAIVALLLVAGVLSALPAQAQNYSFAVPQMQLQVFVEENSAARIVYDITFRNNPGAHPINIVDIGTPTDNYDLDTFSASINGVNLPNIQTSTYIDTGVEIHLGNQEIPAGSEGTLHVEFTIPAMVYGDTTRDDYASLRITPTWFDSSLVTGDTRLQIAIHTQPGVQPEELLSQNVEYNQAVIDQQGRATAVWEVPDWSATAPYMVGLSFPDRNLTGVTRLNAFQLLIEYIEDNPPVHVGLIAALLVLTAVLFFRFSGKTGCALYAVLAAVLGFCSFTNPVLLLGAFVPLPFLFFFNERYLRSRKDSYLPAIAQVEGGGIKRGLTAPESAVIIEQPLNKVLGLVIFAMLKKGVLRQTSAEPLTVEVADDFRLDDDPQHTANPIAARQKAAQQHDIVIHTYEHRFLDAIERNPGKPLKEIDFGEPMQKLIEHAAARIKGFDLSDTQDYYRSIVRRALKQAESIGDIEQRQKVLDRNLEWILMNENYGDVFSSGGRRGYRYRPIWMRPYMFGGFGGSSSGSGSGFGGGGSGADIAGQTSFGDVAASFAGWTENTMGGLADAIMPGSVQMQTAAGGVVDLSGVDHATGEFFEALAKSSSSGGGGGGGGCACACAGCACACACAGGGR